MAILIAAASREWGYASTFDQRLTADDITPATTTTLAGVEQAARRDAAERRRTGGGLRWRYGLWYQGRPVAAVRAADGETLWQPGYSLLDAELAYVAGRDGAVQVELA